MSKDDVPCGEPCGEKCRLQCGTLTKEKWLDFLLNWQKEFPTSRDIQNRLKEVITLDEEGWAFYRERLIRERQVPRPGASKAIQEILEAVRPPAS